MKNKQLIDHLFRHQFGKMVAILTRIFGLKNLETVEDAVQDTFVLAMLKWRDQIPKNPEAWLTKAAKNRAIDLLRKIKAEGNRFEKIEHGLSVTTLDELFLDYQIADSQLRMIFTACHPDLHAKDQIAFALKTVAGFSTKEIASALLLKEDTVKKRLSRARKSIQEKHIAFDFPDKKDVPSRLERVYEVLYLIFNEGFHSNHQKVLIRQDLCGEALRLTKLVLSKPELRTGSGYALFALMCFHAARLESKMSENGKPIDLKHQDRSKYHFPLIKLGNEAMNKAMQYGDTSTYHIEAAIAVEHLKAKSFAATNWEKILKLYKQLYEINGDEMTKLNIIIVLLQLQQNVRAKVLLDNINPTILEQRVYLFWGVKAEYYINIGQKEKAIDALNRAIEKTSNQVEKDYLSQKKETL